MKIEKKKKQSESSFIRLCHNCCKINEAIQELNKCEHCGKGFLPLRYFEKVHSKKPKDFNSLFSSVEYLEEDDLIKGLIVLW